MMERIRILLIIYLYTFALHGYAKIEKESIDDNMTTISNIGLRVVQINTIHSEEPTCEYISHPEGCWGEGITNATIVPGQLIISLYEDTLYNSGPYIDGESGMTLKIRGNTSTYTPKKPYKIKLQKKADLLHRGNDSIYKDKEWILLKYDGFKTSIGLKVNQLMGMPWTPAYEYVNVFLNNRFIGLYMLIESVKRNPDCRLNVDTSGFLFEYDAYWWNEDLYVKSDLPWPCHYTFKYPDAEKISEKSLSYFEDMITTVETSVQNGTYNQYIEINSFILWELSHEILGNYDAGGSNIYLTKYDDTDTSLIKMCNLWDFDNIERCTEWAPIHEYFYYPNLFRNTNKLFAKKYVRTWRSLSPIVFQELFSYMDSIAEEKADMLNEAIKYDNQCWSNAHESIENKIMTSKDWFSDRYVWLDNAMNTIDTIPSPYTKQLEPPYDVYNIQGARIRTNAYSVEDLPNGFYIIDKEIYYVK